MQNKQNFSTISTRTSISPNTKNPFSNFTNNISPEAKYTTKYNNFDHSPLTDSNNDWKKVVGDRLIKRIMKYKDQRYDLIRESKDEILKEIQYENFMHCYGDEENLLLSEYFDKI